MAAYWPCVRHSFFLCLPNWKVWQFFRQLQNKVLLYSFVNSQLVDHGDVMFDHLFFDSLLAGDGSLSAA